MSISAGDTANQAADASSLVLEAWKKTVDVQQHFNDLELRIRNYALTLLAATFGAAGFVLKEQIPDLVLFGLGAPVVTLVLFAGLVIWSAFYFMDRWWYHRLLYGAVQHGAALEKSVADTLPQLGLGKAISAASPFKLGKYKIHTTRKIDIFYGVIAGILILAILVTALADSPRSQRSSWVTVTDVATGQRLTVNAEHVLMVVPESAPGHVVLKLRDGSTFGVLVDPSHLESLLRHRRP